MKNFLVASFILVAAGHSFAQEQDLDQLPMRLCSVGRVDNFSHAPHSRLDPVSHFDANKKYSPDFNDMKCLILKPEGSTELDLVADIKDYSSINPNDGKFANAWDLVEQLKKRGYSLAHLSPTWIPTSIDYILQKPEVTLAYLFSPDEYDLEYSKPEYYYTQYSIQSIDNPNIVIGSTAGTIIPGDVSLSPSNGNIWIFRVVPALN